MLSNNNKEAKSQLDKFSIDALQDITNYLYKIKDDDKLHDSYIDTLCRKITEYGIINYRAGKLEERINSEEYL